MTRERRSGQARDLEALECHRWLPLLTSPMKVEFVLLGCHPGVYKRIIGTFGIASGSTHALLGPFREEVASNPKAKASVQKEWNKLRDLGCWDEKGVREWADVKSVARRENSKVHVGRIFDICVERNHELDENDPNRKYEGRVVFEGCHVKDESNAWAIFSEVTSCPATMASGKITDAYGLLPGHSLQASDGESAYTQTTPEEPSHKIGLVRVM